MSKSEAKASSSKKRKHAEVDDSTTNAIVSSSSKKAKKSDKKGGDKNKSKSHKERKAEAAEALNAQEYDLEDVAMGDVRDDGEEKEEKVEEKKSSKKDKKEGKKSKKEKKAEKAEKSAAAAATNTEGEEQVTEDSKDKSKSKSKDKKTKKDKKDTSNGSKKDVAAGENGEEQQADATAEAEAQNGEEEGNAGKKSRFICFVGNLPFSATKTDIANHFASLKPASIRLLTERNAPTKSRGIAFVEFDNYSHMKTCLAKFHHTEMLDPKTKQPRRINVELTAGGGGKTKGRMDKLAEKNQKLNEERARRIATEEAAKLENAKLKREKESGGKMEDNREEVYVHPSRRAHVPGKRS